MAASQPPTNALHHFTHFPYFPYFLYFLPLLNLVHHLAPASTPTVPTSIHYCTTTAQYANTERCCTVFRPCYQILKSSNPQLSPHSSVLSTVRLTDCQCVGGGTRRGIMKPQLLKFEVCEVGRCVKHSMYSSDTEYALTLGLAN